MSIHLADEQVVADFDTYVGRALAMDEDGAIRLQAAGGTLAAWVGVRKPRGLMGEGTVLGLRVMPIEPADDDVDVVVALRAVADRLARMLKTDDRSLEIPPVTVRTSWAGVTPPRSGWTPLGTLPASVLNDAARAGIEKVALGTPMVVGAAAVEQLRQRVWDTPIEGTNAETDGLPAGAALGMYGLGFLNTDDVKVFATARWHRVSSPVGHVLVR